MPSKREIPVGRKWPSVCVSSGNYFRERSVRMVFDQAGQYASQWEAIRSIAEQDARR